LKAQFLIRALGYYYSEDNYCGQKRCDCTAWRTLIVLFCAYVYSFLFIFAHLCSNICIKILHVCIYWSFSCYNFI